MQYKNRLVLVLILLVSLVSFVNASTLEDNCIAVGGRISLDDYDNPFCVIDVPTSEDNQTNQTSEINKSLIEKIPPDYFVGSLAEQIYPQSPALGSLILIINSLGLLLDHSRSDR